MARCHSVVPCGRGVDDSTLFEGSAVLFEGVTRRPYRSGWYSVTELTLALPHSAVQWRGWPHQEGWRNSAGI
jgi:hypothetical protein